MKTIILHVGMPKAGSKSIQITLAGHRRFLAAHGIDYLRAGTVHSRLLKAIGSDEEARITIPPDVRRSLGLDSLTRHVPREKLRSALRRRIEESRAPVVFLSGEAVYRRPREELEELHGFLAPLADRIVILAYLREPLEWATSRIQQSMKVGIRLKIDGPADMPDYGHPEYVRPITDLRAVFGQENVILRIFSPKHWAGGELIADLCHAVGFPAEVVAGLTPIRANESLCHEGVALLQAISARVDRDASRGLSIMHRTLDRLRGVPGTRFALPQAVLEDVWEKIEPELDWLSGEFGVRPFEKKIPKDPGPLAWDADIAKVVAMMIDKAPRRRKSGKPGNEED